MWRFACLSPFLDPDFPAPVSHAFKGIALNKPYYGMSGIEGHHPRHATGHDHGLAGLSTQRCEGGFGFKVLGVQARSRVRACRSGNLSRSLKCCCLLHVRICACFLSRRLPRGCGRFGTSASHKVCVPYEMIVS